MRALLSLLACLIFPLFATAQEKKGSSPGDAMIEKYLATEVDRLSKKYLDGAKSLDEWKQKRPRLYQEYMDMLGLWPLPEKTPLRATKTGEIEAHGVVVEKIHFQSKPGLYVTANVYRPKSQDKRLPTILYVCGHAWKGRDGNKSASQDHGFWYANHGYLCIILDSLQLGEIPGVHHGTYGRPWAHLKNYGIDDPKKPAFENRLWWPCLGYTPAGVECWNGMRAIDYLCTRPDVDPDRIGVTGISGGGAATFWIAAADERVKVAVPVSGMADLECYVNDKIINGHCDCMFLQNTYQWDWTTIAAMIAPRPMLFANSDKDAIFPMDANRRVIAKLKKIYTMYEKPNLVDEYISPGGHAYRPDLRVASFKFMNQHLKGDTTTSVEDSAKYTPLKGMDVRVFPDELPKDSINDRIDELFITPAKVVLPKEGEFVAWKQELIEKLRAASFRNLPRDIKAGSHHQDGKNLIVTTDQVIQCKISLPDRGGVVYIQRSGSVNDFTMGIYSRGDAFPWTKKSPPNYVERSHVLLGQTIDEGRLSDILTLLRTHESIEKKPMKWSIGGSEQEGILAAYAALFDSSIKEVTISNPPRSHKEGPYFLNVIKLLDIPVALGLLAPLPLTIIGGQDPAFDRTAEIYRLAGASDKLKRN